MTFKFKPHLIFLSAILVSSQTWAQNQSSSTNEEIAPYVHSETLYPPVLMLTNFESPDLKERLINYNAFQSVNSDTPGRPLKLRIVRGFIEEHDATKATSVLLAASTLGLIPVVSNKVFRVRYDLIVRNESVEHFQYDLPVTDVSNFWSGNKKNPELNEEQQTHFDQSVDRFLSDLSKSQIAKTYFDEYVYYFQ